MKTGGDWSTSGTVLWIVREETITTWGWRGFRAARVVVHTRGFKEAQEQRDTGTLVDDSEF